jgi:hypothetical protein
MFWALVIPELMLAWSAKQWWMAGETADTYNREKGETDKTPAYSFLGLCEKIAPGIETPGTWDTFWSFVKSYFRGKSDEETGGTHDIWVHIISLICHSLDKNSWPPRCNGWDRVD